MRYRLTAPGPPTQFDNSDSRELREIIQKLEAITKEPGFIYTLALILMRDLFMAPEQIVDINPREHLNFQEITFLTGLLVKEKFDLTLPSEDDSARRFEEVYRLFNELHKKYMEPLISELGNLVAHGTGSETREQNYRRIFGAGTMMTESIFYSGSGAYDFQYLRFAGEKYQNDSLWIREHVGLDVPEMCEIAARMKALHERKFNDLFNSRPDGFTEICKAGLSVFCFAKEDFQGFETERAERFLQAFSLKPGEVNANLETPGQYNRLQSNPIVRLDDGRYFLPVGFNISEAIYETPFYWMNSDKSYADTAFENRGLFAEEITARLMTSVFGAKNVYRDVEVREKKGRAITDIDVLAIVGNKAVIAQVKSKRLTELARLGDEKRLVADFEAAV